MMFTALAETEQETPPHKGCRGRVLCNLLPALAAGHRDTAGTILAGLKHDVEARDDAAFLLTISSLGAAKLDTHRHEGEGS